MGATPRRLISVPNPPVMGVNAAGGQVMGVEKENEHGVMQYEAKVKGSDGK